MANLKQIPKHATDAFPEPIGPAPIGIGSTGLAELTEAKLWRNPCWFAFRFNHIALHYNTPLYGWVKQRTGLSRPEFVVIYSLGLIDGTVARDISLSSGFPKNTLSRAINKLCRLGLIERRTGTADRRNQTLHLLPAGRTMFDESLPQFVLFEERMLRTLSASERKTLSNLLAKIVLDTPNWAAAVDEDAVAATEDG